MPGFSELVLILIVVLVIFGAGKLPAIATAIGEAVVRLRDRASGHDGVDEETEEDTDDPPSS